MKRILLVSLVLVLIATVGMAQLKVGGYGIQTGVTGGGATLGGMYNFAEDMRIVGNLGFTSEPSSFNIGGGVQYCLGTSENFSTFIGASIGIGTATNYSSFGLQAQYGAEYWFSKRFSIIGFLQFGLTSGGFTGSKTTSVGTSTGTALNFYLN